MGLMDRVTAVMAILRRSIFGFDFFISYSWDAMPLAENLERGLLERDYSVFRDASHIEAGDMLTATIRLALRRTKNLIVIGSEGALGSSWVRDEIENFSQRKRPILPLNVEGVLANQPWWKNDIPLYINVELEKPLSSTLDVITAKQHGLRTNQLARFLTFITLSMIILTTVGFFLSARAAADRNAERLRSHAITDFGIADSYIKAGDVESGIAFLTRGLTSDPNALELQDRLYSLMASPRFPIKTSITEELGWSPLSAEITENGVFMADELHMTISGKIRNIPNRFPTIFPDGSAIAFLGEEGVIVWDVERDILRNIWSSIHGVTGLHVAPSGDYILLQTNEEILLVSVAKPVAIVSRRVEDLDKVYFSNEGLHIVATTPDSIVTLASEDLSVLQTIETSDMDLHWEYEWEVKDLSRNLMAVADLDPGGLQEPNRVEIHIVNPVVGGWSPVPEWSNILTSWENEDVLGFYFDPYRDRAIAILSRGIAEWVGLSVGNGESTVVMDQLGMDHARFSPYSDHLLTIGSEGTPRIWDAKGQLVCELRDVKEVISAGFVSESKVVCVNSAGQVSKWILPVLPDSFSPSSVPPVMDSQVAKLNKIDGRGHWQLLRPGLEPISIRDPIRSDSFNTWEASGGFYAITCGDVSQDGDVVVTAAGNQNPKVWSGTGSQESLISMNSQFVNEIWVSQNGQQVLFRIQTDGTTLEYGVNSYAYRLYNLLDDEWFHEAVDLRRGEVLLAASPDLSDLLIAINGHIYRQETVTGRKFTVVAQHSGVLSATYLDAGTRFVTASSDGNIRIWDPDTMLPCSETLPFTDPIEFNNDEPIEIPKPTFIKQGYSIILPWNDWFTAPDASHTDTRYFEWPVSLGLARKQSNALAKIAEAATGIRVDESGLVQKIPQKSLRELYSLTDGDSKLISLINSMVRGYDLTLQ